ncbi:hypothetical protein KFE25_000002 [Diacronema lutheri]|uniref:Pterin-binding domain-containing protein n=1 Tax=Diacronema lutheri TaxID=2081491 RepID=A0A8J5XNM2_DIALT|nr:hypothetical protein KFE25_000002 [Diacronema lutheri]
MARDRGQRTRALAGLGFCALVGAFPQPAPTRRAVCVGAGALLLARSERAAAASPASGAAGTERVRAVLIAFERLSASWEDATTDCRFGEVKRELLGASSKAELLEEASTFATFNKEKTMNVLCKRSTALMGDISTINAYAKGSDDGGSENLVQAQRNVAEGARVLRRAVEIVDAGGTNG